MRCAAVLTISLLILLAPIPSAAQTPLQAHSSYEVIRGFNVPATPDALDQIAFARHWFGIRSAPTPPAAVLILVPGFFGGSEDFGYVGERLVTRLPWLQVWAVDRRNNLLENRCGMEAAQSLSNPLAAFAYYFGGQALPGCPISVDDDDARWAGAQAEFALSQAEADAVGMREWGLNTLLQDIRRLVAHARQQYPWARVYLGGHSLGGMTAQIYAAWRFGNTPPSAGWRTIDGVVLIDGGVDGQNWASVLVPQYLFDHTLLDQGMVYWDLIERGAAPLVGQFGEIAGMAASFAPGQESMLWQVLPPPFTWASDATCPTNKALLGTFSDNDTGQFSDFMMHQGSLSGPAGACAAPNQTRLLLDWVDFNEMTPPELSSTDRWAQALWSSRATNAVEWYFSIVLNADLDLASNLDSTEPIPALGGDTAFDREGHRVFETTRVRLPVYVFAAAECRERFEWYRSVSTSISDFTLVDRSNTGCPSPAAVPYAHLDPLFAADTGGFTNAFVSTLAAWLRTHALTR